MPMGSSLGGLSVGGSLGANFSTSFWEAASSAILQDRHANDSEAREFKIGYLPKVDTFG